jgi:LPS-assembly lipoprotein
MSSSDRSLTEVFGRTAALSLLLALPVASACTVQPLYSNPASGYAQSAVTADLSSITIKPVEQRHAQQVRNQLIFLFNRGAGQPASSAYTLNLVVLAQHESGAVVQVGDDNEPTAGTVTLIANYTLTGTTSGETISTGRRQIMASYDVPQQEFAAYRARLDGEDRAARELAQLLQLAIAQDLSR